MRIIIIYLTAIASFWWAMPVLRLSATPTGLVGGTKICPPYATTHKQQTTNNKQQNQPRVELILTVDRQVPIEPKNGATNTGATEFAWQPLSSEDRVFPGEILRYRLVGKNNSSQSVSALVLTQPIPSEMTYILGSARGANNITFSIDNGANFTANPMTTNLGENGQKITQAAPPENYTHVRWNFERILAPGEEFMGTFEVRVR